MAWRYVPAHVNEGTEPVDNLGGLLSLVLVGALILGINFAPVPNATTLTIVLAIVAWSRSACSASGSGERGIRSTTSESPRGRRSGWRRVLGSSSSAR